MQLCIQMIYIENKTSSSWLYAGLKCGVLVLVLHQKLWPVLSILVHLIGPIQIFIQHFATLLVTPEIPEMLSDFSCLSFI